MEAYNPDVASTDFKLARGAGLWAKPVSEVLVRLDEERLLPVHLLGSRDKLPSVRLASLELIMVLFHLVIIHRLGFRQFLSEMMDVIIRRWRLASSPGPQTWEEELVVACALGWDHPVQLYRRKIGMWSTIRRFAHRGTSWRRDLLIVCDMTSSELEVAFLYYDHSY